MAPPIELSGVSIVGAGSFNPAIFQPRWLLEKQLITENAAEAAQEKLVVTPEMTAFTADWLTVQVTLQQAQFATVEEGRDPDLRDVAKGVLDVLPETPVNAIGINSDTHYRVESDEAWHAVGDRLLPKGDWEPLFADDRWKRRENGNAVGLRTVTAEVHRSDGNGFVRIEVAPSIRVTPHGVYIGINAHFQLTKEEGRGNGYQAARTIEEYWEESRALEAELVDRLAAFT